MWTYDPTDLDKDTLEGKKNIVRFLVGDTQQNDPQVQDEEIFYTLDISNGKPYVAAVSVVSAIISRYARLVNVELDEAIKENYSDLVKNYTLLRKDLASKSRFSNGSIQIIATGLTKQDFDTARHDTERLTPGIQQYKWRDYPYDISHDGYISVTKASR